jgi:hypothetical protein
LSFAFVLIVVAFIVVLLCSLGTLAVECDFDVATRLGTLAAFLVLVTFTVVLLLCPSTGPVPVDDGFDVGCGGCGVVVALRFAFVAVAVAVVALTIVVVAFTILLPCPGTLAAAAAAAAVIVGCTESCGAVAADVDAFSTVSGLFVTMLAPGRITVDDFFGEATVTVFG